MRGSLCSSSGSLRDSGWWLRKEFQENPTSRACPPGLRQASGRSHHGGVGEGLCAGRRPAGPLLPLPLLSRSPLGAALSGDACAAPRIPPCSEQQRPGGTRTHCWLRLPRPGTDLELVFMGVAGAGRDRSPVCPWPGPPLAGHASIQQDRCEVRPELSGPALGGWPGGSATPGRWQLLSVLFPSLTEAQLWRPTAVLCCPSTPRVEASEERKCVPSAHPPGPSMEPLRVCTPQTGGLRSHLPPSLGNGSQV